MQFKDAAYIILKKAGQPLHYKEIAARAWQARLLKNRRRALEFAMGDLLYFGNINPESRFYRHRKTPIATPNRFLVFRCIYKRFLKV